MTDLCSFHGFHIMMSWSEPKPLGVKMIQERKCAGCNLVEYREVKILNEVVAN